MIDYELASVEMLYLEHWEPSLLLFLTGRRTSRKTPSHHI